MDPVGSSGHTSAFAADSGQMTGHPEVILHSRTLLAETLLQTALRAMIRFHLPDKLVTGHLRNRGSALDW